MDSLPLSKTERLAIWGVFGGRPTRPTLEFHCTAPIQTSRAEEILFGPTLLPHLFCERLGAALIAKATKKVSLIVVNQLDSWALADETSLPVVLLHDASNAGTASPRTESASSAPLEKTQLDRVDPTLRPHVEEQLQELTRYVELNEPFERIVEAIHEAGQLERETTSEEVSTERRSDEGGLHENAA